MLAISKLQRDLRLSLTSADSLIERDMFRTTRVPVCILPGRIPSRVTGSSLSPLFLGHSATATVVC